MRNSGEKPISDESTLLRLIAAGRMTHRAGHVGVQARACPWGSIEERRGRISSRSTPWTIFLVLTKYHFLLKENCPFCFPEKVREVMENQNVAGYESLSSLFWHVSC